MGNGVSNTANLLDNNESQNRNSTNLEDWIMVDQINQIDQTNHNPYFDEEIMKIDKRLIDIIKTYLSTVIELEKGIPDFLKIPKINLTFLQKICTLYSHNVSVYYTKEFFVMFARFINKVYYTKANQLELNRIICDICENHKQSNLFDDFYNEYIQLGIFNYCHIPIQFYTKECVTLAKKKYPANRWSSSFTAWSIDIDTYYDQNKFFFYYNKYKLIIIF